MALSPLATNTDLSDRGIDISDTSKVAALLDSASAEVRYAAGTPISQQTVTVTVPGVRERWLALPAQPVTAVSSVLLDGDAISDWVLSGGRLWRECGWLATWYEPCNVEVSLTGGLSEVPADIVDLVCSLVSHGLAHSAHEPEMGKVSESIDDYRVGYQYSGQAGVMELPEATRNRLAKRFGGGVSLHRSGWST